MSSRTSPRNNSSPPDTPPRPQGHRPHPQSPLPHRHCRAAAAATLTAVIIVVLAVVASGVVIVVIVVDDATAAAAAVVVVVDNANAVRTHRNNVFKVAPSRGADNDDRGGAMADGDNANAHHDDAFEAAINTTIKQCTGEGGE